MTKNIVQKTPTKELILGYMTCNKVKKKMFCHLRRGRHQEDFGYFGETIAEMNQTKKMIREELLRRVARQIAKFVKIGD